MNTADRATSIDLAGALQRLRADLITPASTGAWPRGAVGAHDATGNARYAYPEIAGYWLHWACARRDVPAAHGEAVLDWLDRTRRAHGHWPARIADVALPEGYARTRYLFDHAMLWHGLTAWAVARRSASAAALASLAWADATAFVDGDRLVAAHGALEERWSTAGGPFLLKACARLRRGSGVLAQAAAAHCMELAKVALRRPHAESHPQLYAIEGLLDLGQPTAAALALSQLLADHGGPLAVREVTDQGPQRSDVLAQLLRVVLFLVPDARDDAQWTEVAAALAARVDARGRLPFARNGDDCATWAQLFAEQALSWWCGETPPAHALV